MKNESGLHPAGVAVLILPYEPEVEKSIIALPDQVKERGSMMEARAIIVEVGPEAWKDEASPRAKPGDKVLVTKFAGYCALGTKDKKLYRLVNDRDIFCQIED